mgnify:CR=1 FL=1
MSNKLREALSDAIAFIKSGGLHRDPGLDYSYYAARIGKSRVEAWEAVLNRVPSMTPEQAKPRIVFTANGASRDGAADVAARREEQMYAQLLADLRGEMEALVRRLVAEAIEKTFPTISAEVDNGVALQGAMSGTERCQVCVMLGVEEHWRHFRKTIVQPYQAVAVGAGGAIGLCVENSMAIARAVAKANKPADRTALSASLSMAVSPLKRLRG